MEPEGSLPCSQESLVQMNPVHNFSSYFLKIIPNITLPPTTRSSDRYPPFRYSDLNFARTSHISHACYV